MALETVVAIVAAHDDMKGLVFGSSEFLLVKRVKCGMFTEAVEKKSMVV